MQTRSYRDPCGRWQMGLRWFQTLPGVPGPMVNSTVWRAREPRAEVDTIPTLRPSAFDVSGMSGPESMILAADMPTGRWTELRADA